MWYIILAPVILVFVGLRVAEHVDIDNLADWTVFWVGYGLLAGLLLLLLGIFAAIPLTTGLMPSYSEGQREGYVTKLSHKGVVFKTWEGELQVGTGNLAALQAPWSFSVPDKKVLSRVVSHDGRKVVVKYKQWLIMPYRLGSSGVELLEVREMK